MAIIKSGNSTDQLTIDPTSKAARVTLYDAAGNTPPAAAIPVSVTGIINTDDVSSSSTGALVPAEAIQIGLNKAGTLVAATADVNGNLNVNISDVGGNAATAKGVQPVAAIPTQDLKDSGRTSITLYADRVAGVAAEALMTLSINKAGTVTTGASYTVTNGKIFRIQSLNAEILNTTTVANRVLVRVRVAPTVLVTSPIVAMAMAAASAALAASGATDPHSYPDGIEIQGGQQIGVSQLSTVTTAGIVSVTIVGYEY